MDEGFEPMRSSLGRGLYGSFFVDTIAHYSTFACSHTELATIPKTLCIERTAAYPRAYRAFTQERHIFGKCIASSHHTSALEAVIGVCLLWSETMIHDGVCAHMPYVYDLWNGRCLIMEVHIHGVMCDRITWCMKVAVILLMDTIGKCNTYDEHMADSAIAELEGVDRATVWRRRQKLIRAGVLKGIRPVRHVRQTLGRKRTSSKKRRA